MGKRIEIDGKFYRMRRGELVEIPADWAGHTTHPQSIRGRRSKLPKKLRKDDKHQIARLSHAARKRQLVGPTPEPADE